MRMRMAELSAESGVPVATIKYYLREGLLPPGERTSPNQALYAEGHVRRLTMVRALIEVAGMSVGQVRDVLNTSETNSYKLLGEVQDRLPPTYPEGEGEEWDAAQQVVVDLIERLGWRSNPYSPPGRALVAAVRTLYELGRPDLVNLL